MLIIILLVYSLPQWVDYITKYTNETLEQTCSIYIESFFHTDEMKKIKGGFLIKEILDRFRNKTLSILQPDRSLWFYSAHDLTIARVLNALNLYEVN